MNIHAPVDFIVENNFIIGGLAKIAIPYSNNNYQSTDLPFSKCSKNSTESKIIQDWLPTLH